VLALAALTATAAETSDEVDKTFGWVVVGVLACACVAALVVRSVAGLRHTSTSVLSMGSAEFGTALEHLRACGSTNQDPIDVRQRKLALCQQRADDASAREVFGRPIGANQGVQFPIARAYMQIRAADLMRYEAARRFDAGQPCGAEANMAKLLSSEAGWEPANVCLDTHGGNGFVDAFDVERKFRETRLYQVAPVNTTSSRASWPPRSSAFRAPTRGRAPPPSRRSRGRTR
jgi:hypothetical protein